jgi:hypothetical protein
MKAYEIMKKQHKGSPRNPRLGQIWFEPYTATMRVWNGRHWQETSGKEIKAKKREHGTIANWIRHDNQKGKLL